MNALLKLTHKLQKQYNKLLKKIHKRNFGKNNNLEYFITYLQYMRDYCILTEDLTTKDGQQNMRLSTLVTAIFEYNEYKNCILKYYHVNGAALVEPISTDTPKEEVFQAYNKERMSHWSNFWQLVMLNIEDWVWKL